MNVKAPLTKWALRVGKLVVLLGALGATFGIFAIVSLQLALRSREVPVPSLSGLTPQEAEVLLADEGLTLEVDPVRRVHDRVTSGRIAAQDPSPGLATRSRRSVKIWLSSGSTPGSVPMLIGASDQAAIRRLEENGFALEGVSEIRSNRYPADAVVAQHQPADSNGEGVSLLVNRGERGSTYVMPDLIGVGATTASEVLRGRGFRVTVVADHPYPGVPPGSSCASRPKPDFR